MSAYDAICEDLASRNRPLSDQFGTHRVGTNVLQLGDRVKLGSDAFDWATVVYVDAESVRVLRPYVHTSDFSMCSGSGSKLIGYIGQEEVTLRRDDTRVVTVAFRRTVPK